MLGAKVAILKLTHILHVASRERYSAQTRARAKAGVILITLLLCGDVEINPLPNYKYPCGVCGKPVQCNQKGIECDKCELWHHIHCTGMSDYVYQYLECHEDLWFCFHCSLPELSDSYFNAEEDHVPIASIDLNASSTSSSSILQKSDLSLGLALLQECKSSAVFCHLNAQSLLPKMDELRDTLTNAKHPVILEISETWLGLFTLVPCVWVDERCRLSVHPS